MYIFFSFLLGGIAFTIWILEFDKKQTKKINIVLKESKNVSQMFMLKSAEQKINKLKTALSDDGLKNKSGKVSIANIYNNSSSENNKQLKIQELIVLSSKYNEGLISIEDYNSKLDELLEQVKRNGSYGLAC
jgi:hypothetical protein